MPDDKEVAAAWLAKIKRVTTPKLVYLCERHFDEEAFDRSVDLRNSLLPEERRMSRKLNPGAIPTKFSHNDVAAKRTGSGRLERSRLLNSLLEESNIQHTTYNIFGSFSLTQDSISTKKYIF